MGLLSICGVKEDKMDDDKYKLLNYIGLAYYDEQIKKLFVTKEELPSDLNGFAKLEDLPGIATVDQEGLVKPDGTSITITPDGVISAGQQDLAQYAKKTDLPKIATVVTAGIVKPDGETVTIIDDGTITAVQPDLSDYVHLKDIANMLTKVDAEKVYAKKTDLNKYALAVDIQDMETQTHAEATYAKITEAATKNELTLYVKTSVLDNYAKKADIVSVYKPKGSLKFQDLEGLNKKSNLGNVYNITDAFMTDSNFIDNTSGVYPSGTNVVVVEESDGVYKFDVLAGNIDLTPYLKAEDIALITNADIDQLFAG